MTIIGITGPTGSGKSSCSAHLQALGIPVIDADRIYHLLIEAPSPCTRELIARFGNQIEDPHGGIDRKALAALVFSDPTKRKTEDLNQITHKYVLEETKKLLDEYRNRRNIAVAVDAPLLFEADFDRLCDFCIAVLAPYDVRRERILTRDSLTPAQADARLGAQKDDAFYTSRAKYVIVNNADIGITKQRIKEILEKEGVAI